MGSSRMMTALFLAACALPVPALAQSSSEVAAARQLFREGLAAAERGEWAEALSSFERSYAITPRMSTLLNIAGAQVETGQLVAATESYRRYLAEAREGRDARYRAQAERALAEIEPRLVQLTLRVEGVERADTIALGARELTHAVLGVALPVDPGTVELVVRRGEAVLVRETLVLEEGEAREVELRVPVAGEEARPVARVPEAALRDEEAPRASGGDEVAWIVGVVAAVLGVATAVTVGVVLATEASAVHQGTLGVGVIGFD